MTPESAPPGWRRASYGDALAETDERAGERTHLPVLSVTKSRGPMLASERFGKTMHGRDLSRYRVAPRNHVVADPMLLWDGSIGIQRVVDAGLVSPDYRVYKPTESAEPSFVAHLVRSPLVLSYYQGGARGTNVRRNRIGRADFLSIPVSLPPLGEQRQIAAILSAVDDAIEATQAVIEQLQVVKKAMMAELLVRGLPGRHTRFKQTEIGEVPEEWDVVRLDSSAVVQTGVAKGKSVDDGVELPYLRVANVQDGFVDLTEMKSILVERSSVDRFRLREGDVLFTEGGDADKLGRGCVWRGQIDPCLHQNHVFAVRPDAQRLRPEFLALWAASSRGKAYFLDCAKQTTNLASINSTQLKALPVPLPSAEVQDEVISVISSISNRVDAERACHEQLMITKAALTSVLLTGEVRVTRDEAAA